MKLFAEIVFFISAYAMLHTYLLYPLAMILLAGKKKNKNKTIYTNTDEWPLITIVCAAYNEEKVIEEKIKSTFNTSYPLQKITLLIGTDNCSDQTVTLIKKMQAQYAGLQLREFTTRTGKIGILNTLVKEVKSDIVVLTDANVYFNTNTLYQLTKHFKNPGVALVCGNILKTPLSKGAVTQSELSYMNFENRLKLAESVNFNIVIGAEGGCYAVRKEVIREIPSHFIADDFFITCLALQKKTQVLFEPEATVQEDLLADTSGEFRRKARIATGNFQNLFYFLGMALKLWTVTSFCFLSHKVMRWKTPFYFLACLVIAAVFQSQSPFFKIIFWAQLTLLILPLLNKIMTGLGLKLKPLIAISHFMLMNAALLTGFFRFVRGVKSSVWEPVKR